MLTTHTGLVQPGCGYAVLSSDGLVCLGYHLVDEDARVYLATVFDVLLITPLRDILSHKDSPV